MTVTRYKRQPATADTIRDAVLGVTRHKRAVPAASAEPARQAKVAPAAGEREARTADELVEHHEAVVKAPVERMRISRDVLARSKRKTPGRASQVPETARPNPFRAYKPPPGILPEGAEPEMALDAGLQGWAESSFTNAWDIANPAGQAFSEGIGFLGYAYLSQLTERPEYRRMSERIAIEMTRKWIRLTVDGEADPESEEDDEDELGKDKAPAAKKAPDRPLSEEEDDDADGVAAGGAVADDQEEEDDEPTPEEKAQRKRNEALQAKVKKIEADMKRLDVRGKFKTVAEYDGWMGRSHLYIDTGDGDDPDELKSDLGNGSDQLSKDKFKKGSLRNIKHIEPIWCYPVNYNANDPLADDWYNPQVWFAMAKQVHVSRLLTFVGRPLPDILKPSYAFGGLSLSQMAKPYVDNWLRTRQAVTALIESFSVSGVYTNAQSLLQGGGDEVLDRIELFNNGRTNAGAMVLDKETEEFFNISTPLGTLDALQAQSQEQMSSVSGIPLIVLLGITPKGLNASSEGELRVFYDLIHAMQEALFRDKLHRILCFIQLNLFGEIDPAIGFEFEPLWSLDEKGEAEVKKVEAEIHQIYVDMGVVGQEEVREIVVADEDSPYNGLDPDELPDPPADDGMIPPGGGGAGGGEGGSSRADNKEVDGAADSANGAVLELAPDVFAFDEFAFDDGQFDESKVKRDQAGKFATTGAGGKAGGEGETAFKTKKEHIAHLLTNGTTPKELMETMGWPSVSMPAQAKSLGMKLQVDVIGGKKVYKGIPMTDAEKQAAKEEAVGKKTDAAAQQILKNAGIEKVVKAAVSPKSEPSSTGYKAPKDYKEFVEHLDGFMNKGDHDSASKLMKYNPSWASQLLGEKAAAEKASKKPMIPQATPEELKKAQKSTALPLSSSDPDAAKAIKDFNEKYAGKEGLSAEQLNQKVHEHKEMLATVKKAESKAAEIAVETAKKEAKAKADKIAAEMNDPKVKEHYEVLAGIGAHQEQYDNAAKAIIEKHGLKITPHEGAYIKAYVGSHYAPVNAQLRSGVVSVQQYKYAAALDRALEKMPKYEGTVYRGVSLDAAQLAKYKGAVGKVIPEPGFQSAGVKQKLWGDTTMVIQSKNARDIRSFNPSEGGGEVVFKNNTAFLVTKVTGNTIHLEEI